jgi:hypothetical protein
MGYVIILVLCIALSIVLSATRTSRYRQPRARRPIRAARPPADRRPPRGEPVLGARTEAGRQLQSEMLRSEQVSERERRRRG